MSVSPVRHAGRMKRAAEDVASPKVRKLEVVTVEAVRLVARLARSTSAFLSPKLPLCASFNDELGVRSLSAFAAMVRLECAWAGAGCERQLLGNVRDVAQQHHRRCQGTARAPNNKQCPRRLDLRGQHH